MASGQPEQTRMGQQTSEAPESTAMFSDQQDVWLDRDVFFTLIDGYAILLDLRSDFYLCLDPDRAAILSDSALVAHNAALTDELVASGILTRDPGRGKNIAAQTILRPEKDLYGYDLLKRPILKFEHVHRFLNSSAKAILCLKWQSTLKVVHGVSARKRQTAGIAPSCAQDQARDLVEIYRTLRPLAFTARDHCLFDSLALLQYLISFGMTATWVFGVQIRPFAAHCWLQDGSLVLNDTVDRVAAFSPIMAI